METTSPRLPELTPERIWPAADYVELVWQDQGSEQDGPRWRSSARTVRRWHD